MRELEQRLYAPALATRGAYRHGPPIAIVAAFELGVEQWEQPMRVGAIDEACRGSIACVVRPAHTVTAQQRADQRLDSAVHHDAGIMR
jgi:hypothetical protein